MCKALKSDEAWVWGLVGRQLDHAQLQLPCFSAYLYLSVSPTCFSPFDLTCGGWSRTPVPQLAVSKLADGTVRTVFGHKGVHARHDIMVVV